MGLITAIIAIALLIAIIGLLSVWGCNRWGAHNGRQNTSLSWPVAPAQRAG